MSLKIQNTKGTFDLPNDYNIEIEDTSPIYNERGSQSAAATLPSSSQNLRLTNHIYRLDTDLAPVSDSRVTVSDGIYRRIGKMNVTQASRHGGIVSNIGFDESEVYSIWNAVSLQSIKGLPVYKPENGTEGIITYLNDIMSEKRTDTPLHIFQVCVAMPERTENDTPMLYPEYLNHTIKNSSGAYVLNSDARTETYLLNNEPVATSIPICYGLTPFLKVSWILNTLFNYYGYTVTENPFDTHPQLSHLVVLNNAADCCVKGFIDYANLMPDCTINEFLQALYCRFGMIYFVDGKTKTVRLKFIKDIIASPAKDNWSNLNAISPTIEYNAPTQLRLSAATGISGNRKQQVAAPTAESLDKFLKTYNYIVSETFGKGYLSYSPHLGLYNVNKLHTSESETVSSDFFPWDKGDNIGYVDISSIDECLPINTLNSSCPGYLVGKVHRYTNISSADIELSEEQTTKTPLCFCFSMPNSPEYAPSGSPRCHRVWSDEPVIDKNGYTYDISMTFIGENGLFNRFWRGYDAILRHANHTVEADLHLSSQQLLNSDFSQPVSMSGQRLLIDSFRYKLPLRSIAPTTVRLRTIKLLKPYDLDKEQTVAIVKQEYKWVQINNRETIVSSVTRDQINQWKSGLFGNVTWLGVNRKNEVEGSVSPAEIPFTVPTKDDYDNKHQPWIKKVNYSFDLYYRTRVQTGTTSGGIPIYKEEEHGGVHYDILYNVWLKAEHI